MEIVQIHKHTWTDGPPNALNRLIFFIKLINIYPQNIFRVVLGPQQNSKRAGFPQSPHTHTHTQPAAHPHPRRGTLVTATNPHWPLSAQGPELTLGLTLSVIHSASLEKGLWRACIPTVLRVTSHWTWNAKSTTSSTHHEPRLRPISSNMLCSVPLIF